MKTFKFAQIFFAGIVLAGVLAVTLPLVPRAAADCPKNYHPGGSGCTATPKNGQCPAPGHPDAIIPGLCDASPVSSGGGTSGSGSGGGVSGIPNAAKCPTGYTGGMFGCTANVGADGTCPPPGSPGTFGSQGGATICIAQPVSGTINSTTCPPPYQLGALFPCETPMVGGKCPAPGGPDVAGDCSYYPANPGFSTQQPTKDCTTNQTCDSFDHTVDPATCATADKSKCNCATITSQNSCNLIKYYVNPLINFMAALAGVAVVISIVIGGIQYSSSAGDSSKASAAKNRIRNALVAVVTFGILYMLLQFVVLGGIS